MKKNQIVILIMILSVNYLQSINFNQVFHVTTFSVNEGLSQYDAPCIIQDKYGFIWASTYDGLNRFDGNSFVQYRHDPYNDNSINGNRVILQYIDSESNTWVITEGGKIDRFNYQTEVFEHFDFEPLKYSIITVFYEDKLHNYWIGTTNGLYKASLKEKSFQVDGIYLNSTNPAYDNYIMALTEDEKNGILVGTASGGVLLSYRGEQIYSPSKFMDGIVINSFFKDKKNTIWICHNYGLSYIKSNIISQLGTINNSMIKNYSNFTVLGIFLMTAIDDDNYLVLSENTLYVLNSKTLKISVLELSDYSFFKDNIIKSVLVDNTKNIWISSIQKGVAKVDLFQKPELIKGLENTRGAVVKSIFKDSKGRFWYGTNLNGMYYYNADGRVNRLLIDGINASITYTSPSMVEDKRGNVWFCANSGVYYYNYLSNKAYSIDKLYNLTEKLNHPFSLDIDRFDFLWIGCSSGLIRVNLKEKNAKSQFISIGSLSDMLSTEQISKIMYDSIHNKVWVCTKDNGVTVVSLDKFGNIKKTSRIFHSQNQTSISSNHVWSVIVASDSTVWFGTDSGLNKCTISGDSITVTPLTNLRLIRNVKIMSIAEDKYNNFWFGTSQALFSYNQKTSIENKYTVADGLLSSAMLEGMYADKTTNLLYVGTTNGISVVNTAPQVRSPYYANVQIVDFRIFGTSIKNDILSKKHLKSPLYSTSEIELSYKENNFTISFLATHYNDFDRNNYIYKLEGYDKDSITTDSKNRSVTYNNLPAGKYHFWVKASNNDNNWSGKKRYLTIVVNPAPWFTIWAYLLYALLIMGVLYFIYRYLNHETTLKQKLVIKELENQHENEMNSMRLRFHTNIAHDIRTPLTLIAGPLEDIKNNKVLMSDVYLSDRVAIVDKNVSRLLYLVNQFLDFRRLLNQGSTLRNETHAVATVFNDIKKSFDGIAVTKKIHFEFVVEVNDHFLIFDIDKLSKIMYNLISNAFKYTPDGGDVFVFVEQQNEYLVLKVQDSGCGISAQDLPHIFERFYQSSGSSSGTGIGLALVNQLVDVCKGRINVSSVVGSGSEFKVVLPCEIPAEMPVRNKEMEDGLEVSDDIVKDEKGAVVLIVDDDEDLRAYLVKSFKDKFTVLQATNGQEAFDKALRFTPDIILTDVMMPQVDGIGLIRLVRNDHRTSHIPIIVLTAKAGENEEIIALEAGAEDFISKPFSTKSLMLKVNNYVRSLSGKKPTDAIEIHSKIADREQAFLNDMNKVILENLENPIFSIDFICEKMAISRMQLHRKIVSLLGKSTSEYIREIKLDEARKYFEKGERDIESVMLRIGVNSSFHFNKNFKLRFGLSIQDFLKSLTKS